MHEILPFLLTATFQSNKSLDAEMAHTTFYYFVQETCISYMDHKGFSAKGACTGVLVNRAMPASLF